MRKRTLWLLVLIVVLVGAVWVLSGGKKPFGKPAEASKKVDPAVVAANTDFGLRLLKQFLADGRSGGNVVISPASVSLALSMTYNGASGDTKDAMAKTLGYQGLSLEQVNAGNKALLANAEAPGEGIEISIANSLWARKEVEFNADFLRRNRDFYGAEITTLDFADPAAKDTINGWVSKETRGRIPEIVDEIGALSVMFLINAIYFKGQWSEQFEKSDTASHIFACGDGQPRAVQMMHRQDHYEYLQGNGLQLINLGYGRGRISMYVLLPAKGVSLSEFSKRLTPENWDEWMRGIRGRKVDVQLGLPRFRTEMRFDLVKPIARGPLCDMGMRVACGERSDFSAMSPMGKSLYIRRVIHKTYIDVNEEGTEAAAATSVEVAVRSAAPPVTSMIVDRPFFFAIRDNMSGELLFLGAISEPR